MRLHCWACQNSPVLSAYAYDGTSRHVTGQSQAHRLQLKQGFVIAIDLGCALEGIKIIVSGTLRRPNVNLLQAIQQLTCARRREEHFVTCAQSYGNYNGS
jgi:hypothetical protein